MRTSPLIGIALASIVSMPTIGQTADMKMDTDAGEVTGYFPSNYEEARHKFLDAAQSVSAGIESLKNPKSGPQGGSLFTDVVLIGPKDAKNILVLVSGTHGVEGFAGSGIQTGLLHSSIFSHLKPKTSILLIHAINPYGFAHLRRWNEDNVDLNRNFVDHSKVLPSNPGYQQLAGVIDPMSISFWANVKSAFRLLWYGLTRGKEELKETISGGQYMNPKGIFFGGHSATWSNKTLRRIAERYLSKARRIVVVDFHTGLGRYGDAEVILNEKKESLPYKRAVKYWGDRVKTTTSGKSVSIHLQGTVKLALQTFVPSVEVTAVSLEFGTFSPLKVFWALRTENWLHHYGGSDHPDAVAIKTALLQAFYPDSASWKKQVWGQGKQIVEQVLVHLP